MVNLGAHLTFKFYVFTPPSFIARVEAKQYRTHSTKNLDMLNNYARTAQNSSISA
jgi:hypothetical protein